ncbi:MAG: hypothetical protein K8T89_15990 [Planctomycetes bacterium]|nr:hypothetical protein [Planctomycetota bacterium]
MSTATRTKPPEKSTEPLPPEAKFWRKYSPNRELSLAAVASGVVHVLGVVLVIVVISRLMKQEETPPVPIRGMVVKPDRPGGLGSTGGGGGDPMTEVKDDLVPQNSQRAIPEAELKREVVAAKAWLPEMNKEAVEKIVQSPGYESFKELNDDLKKRLAKGLGGTGKGNDTGMGDTGTGKGGSGGINDATTSGSRSLRWQIVFKTANGADYLKQLAAFNAKIVIPEPPDWKQNRLFETITFPNPGKPLLSADSLPEMRFIDADKGSAARIARALGLNIDPPYFAAFFPKDMENKMAAMEKSFRNRKEDQIYSTTFQVLERNGAYDIQVTSQVPVRK